jgi:hypothetical protein
MWNDWLSSLNGPSNEQSHIDLPEPMETPKRFNNPQQIERLQSLQAQHQQLQVEQLHLLHRQTELMKRMGITPDLGTADTVSTAPQSPSSAMSASLADSSQRLLDAANPGKKTKSDIHVKSENVDGDDVSDDSVDDNEENTDGTNRTNPSVEVWQQFHSLQAQQWAQALSQARTAKRGSLTSSGGSGGLLSNGSTSASMGVSGVGLLGSGGSGSLSGVAGGKRCKAYAAPKGVWKNNGGYNATIYVHKRRIYGPIRRDLSDAIEDRKEMEEALRELTAIHSSPEDAAILEVEMREVVAGLRNRSTPASTRLDGGLPTSRVLDMSTPPMGILSDPLGGSISGSRKKLRIVGNSNPGLTANSSSPMDDMLDSEVHVDDGTIFGSLMNGHQGQVIKADPMGTVSGSNGFNPLVDMMAKEEYEGSGFTPQTGPLLFSSGASPMMLPGHHGMGMLNDDGLDMLPDPLGSSSGAGLWGCH